jgi:hypothetical protein
VQAESADKTLLDKPAVAPKHLVSSFFNGLLTANRKKRAMGLAHPVAPAVEAREQEKSKVPAPVILSEAKNL